MLSGPERAIAPMAEDSIASPGLYGLPDVEWLAEAARPERYDVFPLVVTDGVPGNGWLWQDVGNDAQIATAGSDSDVIITVPHDNDTWANRADGPRLLHKVTGDFDLDLTMNMSLAEGVNHFAFDEFMLFVPGWQNGYLSGQATSPTSPGADIRLLNGGWNRINGESSLPVWGEDKGITPPDDAMVHYRFSRRGTLFSSQWSLDGNEWTLGRFDEIDAPETLWAGLSFKRMAADGRPDIPAITRLSDVIMESGAPGSLDPNPWLTIQADGHVQPLFEGWSFDHAPDKAGSLAAMTREPLVGDFDAVLRVDLAGAAPQPPAGVAIGLEVVDITRKNWAYVALSSGTNNGGRYQSHQALNGTAGRYDWAGTEDRTGWVRLIRQGGIIRTYYWQLGGWLEVGTGQFDLGMPLFLEIRSWNNWGGAGGPVAFSPEAVIERLAVDVETGSAYTPAGYSVFARLPAPALDLPDGVEAAFFRTPYVVQAPFLDDEGAIYVFPVDEKIDRLVKLGKDGVAVLAGRSEAFTGLNRKRGLWLDKELLVSVDSWPQGGNRLTGVSRVDHEGTATQIPDTQQFGGLVCLEPMPDGNLLLCDIERDGVWTVPPEGGAPVNLTNPPLACAQDAAISGATGIVYAVNNGQSYSCDGNPGLFRVAGDGVKAFLVPEDGRDLGGLVWTTGGMFGGGLLLTDPERGALLRVNERDGSVETVLAGLDRPGDLAATLDGGALAVILGDGHEVLVLRTDQRGPAKPSRQSPQSGYDVDFIPPELTPAPQWEAYGPIVVGALDTLGAVRNGPTRPSEFQIEKPMMLKSVMTYHWNSGQGARLGSIALIDETGRALGDWPAVGKDGQGGVPNAYWYIYPETVLDPGRYRIVDGDPGTWSTNAEVGGRGIFRVELQRVRQVEGAGPVEIK